MEDLIEALIDIVNEETGYIHQFTLEEKEEITEYLRNLLSLANRRHF